MSDEKRYKTLPDARPKTPAQAYEELRKVKEVVNGLLDGRSNNWLDVTLDPLVQTTLVRSEVVRASCSAYFSPRNALSAAALTSLFWDVADGLLTVHHDVSTSPRPFRVLLVG